MNIVKIQINHKEHITIRELSSAFYNEIGEEYDLSEEDVEEFFNIESQLLIPDGTFVTIFTLEFPDIELRDQAPEDIIISYLNSLNEDDNILTIVKTSDFTLYNRALRYYQEIIELEMELRNVLTYIMAFDQRNIDESLFKHFGVGLVKSHDATNASNNYENGFFYILFNQYAEFLEPTELKNNEIFNLLRDPLIQTFEMFRENLVQKGISEERHINFLSSISTQVKTLESMRNAIMHIRNLSNRVVDNYEKATNEQSSTAIKRLIQEFWTQENEALKKQTWLALAKSQISKVVDISKVLYSDDFEGVHDDELFYGINDEHYNDMYASTAGYFDIDALKADLIPYLIDCVEIENFDPSSPKFEAEMNQVIDDVLAAM